MRRCGSSKQRLWLGPGGYTRCSGRRHPNTDAYRYSNRDAYSYADCHCDRHVYSSTHADAKIRTNTAASAYTASKGLDPGIQTGVGVPALVVLVAGKQIPVPTAGVEDAARFAECKVCTPTSTRGQSSE